MSNFQDFYKVLGADMDATDEELKSRYHDLSEIYHPNYLMDDEDIMDQISKAYNFLKDPTMRCVYDLFYKNIIRKENGTQDASMEPTDSMESVQSKRPVTQSVSKESVPSTSSNSSNSMNRSSNYMNSTKGKGTSYHFEISPNAIRNTLRNHHYSEERIHNFLSWCQEHHMKITNGKELHFVFLKYLSMKKETTESVHPEPKASFNCENVHYHLSRDNCYHRKRSMNQNVKTEVRHAVIFHVPFQRELKACQMLIKNHSISSIRNLHIFEFPSLVTLVRAIQNVTIFLGENKSQYKKKKSKTLLKKAS